MKRYEEKLLAITPQTSPLRRAVIENMKLAGKAQGTMVDYIQQIIAWQKKFDKNIANATENDVRKYFVQCQKKYAGGTFSQIYSALKQLYYVTLDCEWSLFTKKKLQYLHKKNYRKCCQMKIANVFSKSFDVMIIAFAASLCTRPGLGDLRQEN